MHVRRTILRLATKFFRPAHDPSVVSGQSSDLMEAYDSFITLYQQGRYRDAEPYAKEALRLGTEEFGPNNPSTADFLNNLALLYDVQGRFAEAEPLYKRALAISEKALGPDHPDLTTGLNNLALLYHYQGRYAQAETSLKRSLEITEKAFGPEHPHVATSLEDFAKLLLETEREAKAKEMEARTKAIRAKHAKQTRSGNVMRRFKFRQSLLALSLPVILAGLAGITTGNAGTAAAVLFVTLIFSLAWLYVFRCPKCRKYSLQITRLPHSNQPEVEFKCRFCGYRMTAPHEQASSE
jgi:tetratricopeptide (TPR) repeat protein